MNCNEPIRETSKLETQCEAMCEQMDLISEKLTGLRSLLQPVLVEKDRTGAAE